MHDPAAPSAGRACPLSWPDRLRQEELGPPQHQQQQPYAPCCVVHPVLDLRIQGPAVETSYGLLSSPARHVVTDPASPPDPWRALLLREQGPIPFFHCRPGPGYHQWSCRGEDHQLWCLLVLGVHPCCHVYKRKRPRPSCGAATGGWRSPRQDHSLRQHSFHASLIGCPGLRVEWCIPVWTREAVPYRWRQSHPAAMSPRHSQPRLRGEDQGTQGHPQCQRAYSHRHHVNEC